MTTDNHSPSSALRRGDVLSYSSGSTNDGPDGFRVVMRAGQPAGSAVLSAIVERWPELLAVLGGASPPMFLNAYPATIGRFESGVVVDSYLSPKTASRALQLAHREGLPVVFMAQPLFAAECLRHHLDAGRPLPPSLVFGVGGYPLLRSLEAALRGWCAESDLHILHFYGLAEIDAAMLLGRDRLPSGAIVYFPRRDVRAEARDGILHISRQEDDGGWTPMVRTGDAAAQEGDGFVFPQAAGRADGAFLQALEAWDEAAWRRRTGYIARGEDGQLVFQLRDGLEAQTPEELGHWRFGERFGFSWLSKPRWR